MNDIRTVLNKLLGRGKPASEKPKAQHVPATVAAASAAPADKSKPYRILVRGADGNFVSKPATAAEALAYCNSERAWRHID